MAISGLEELKSWGVSGWSEVKGRQQIWSLGVSPIDLAQMQAAEIGTQGQSSQGGQELRFRDGVPGRDLRAAWGTLWYPGGQILLELLRKALRTHTGLFSLTVEGRDESGDKSN